MHIDGHGSSSRRNKQIRVVRVDKNFPENLQKLCSLQLMGNMLVIIKLGSRYILFSLYNEVP